MERKKGGNEMRIGKKDFYCERCGVPVGSMVRVCNECYYEEHMPVNPEPRPWWEK
jgi:hypothetical protein